MEAAGEEREAAELMVVAALAACGLVLAASALAHLRRPHALARALAVHGIVPTAAWWPLAIVVVAVEVVLAAALLMVAAVPAGPPDRAVAAAAAGVFVTFAGYLAAVLHRGGAATRAPCGCGLGDEPVTPGVVVRAGALAVLAGTGAVAAPVEALVARTAGEQVVLAAAAVALAVVLARLPAIARAGLSATRG